MSSSFCVKSPLCLQDITTSVRILLINEYPINSFTNVTIKFTYTDNIDDDEEDDDDDRSGGGNDDGLADVRKIKLHTRLR